MEQPKIQRPENKVSKNGEEKSEDITPSELEQCEHPEPGNKSNKSSKTWKKRWQELRDAGTDRHIELFLAFAIMFFAGAQWVTGCKNNSSTAAQVQSLIVAAGRVDKAAESFSQSASGINSGVGAAVSKLNLQASQLAASVNQATKLAANTNVLALQAQRSADYAKQSIDAAVEADRPWVGVSNLNHTNFIEGHDAKITIYYTNSGKRPATVTMRYSAVLMTRLPYYPDLMTPFIPESVGFLLPGAINSGTITYAIPQGAFSKWKLTHQTLFILAQISYMDVGTKTAYITNFCAYYDPESKDIPFPLCTRFNDAK